MKVFLANDHAACEQKSAVEKFLKTHHPDWEILNLGVNNSDRANYPEYALKVSQKVASHPGSRGILLCGSGIGMSMVANKIQGIRAALCGNVEEAKLSRQHNDANVLCLGARLHEANKILDIVKVWLETSFEGGRHQERLDQFAQLGTKL